MPSASCRTHRCLKWLGILLRTRVTLPLANASPAGMRFNSDENPRASARVAIAGQSCPLAKTFPRLPAFVHLCPAGRRIAAFSSCSCESLQLLPPTPDRPCQRAPSAASARPVSTKPFVRRVDPARRFRSMDSVRRTESRPEPPESVAGTSRRKWLSSRIQQAAPGREHL